MNLEGIEKLKQKIKESIKEFISRYKYIILILIFILLVLLIFFFERDESNLSESQIIKIFGITLENWLQWITIVTIPYGAGWAIYQFEKGISAKKQEKATKIAKEFSKDIINKCGIVYIVYKNSSLNDLLKFDEKNYNDFKFFNTDELREIYKDDNFPSKYEATRERVINELDEIYHEVLRMNINKYDEEHKDDILGLKVNIKNDKVMSVEEVHRKPNEKELFILQNKELPYHFTDLESELLNKLEYICMDISSKATDSRYIYQSLHQMFLRTVRALAVQMSIDNKNFSDKYYVNIIHVYNEWTNRYMKDLKVEKRKKEKINKILNPKVKTV